MPTLPPDSAHIRYLFRADMGTFQDTGLATPAVNNNDTVMAWVDQGGNNNHLLIANNSTFIPSATFPTLKTNQINGLPCVNSDGTNWFDFKNAFVSPNRTIYVVIRVASNPSTFTLLCGNSRTLQWRLDGNKQRLVDCANADIGFGTNTIANNVWTQLNLSWDGNNAVFRMAQAADGTQTYAPLLYGVTRSVGANQASTPPAERFTGDRALFLEYAAIHDTPTKQSVEAWIQGTWGV